MVLTQFPFSVSNDLDSKLLPLEAAGQMVCASASYHNTFHSTSMNPRSCMLRSPSLISIANVHQDLHLPSMPRIRNCGFLLDAGLISELLLVCFNRDQPPFNRDVRLESIKSTG